MAIRKGAFRVERDYFSMSRPLIRLNKLTWEARGMVSFIASNTADFEISEANLVAASPAGRDVVRRIVRELKDAGILVVIQARGERGRFGNEVIYELVDPDELSSIEISTKKSRRGFPERDETGRAADRRTGNPSNGDEPVDNEKTPGHDRRTGYPSDGDEPVDNSHRRTGPPSTGNPSAYKEEKIQIKKSSSSNAGEQLGAVPVGNGDDDSLQGGVEAVEDRALAAIEARLSGATLRASLSQAGIDPSDIRLTVAASEILAAAPSGVGSPSRYVAQGIINQPGRWSRTLAQAAGRRPSEPMCPTCLSYELRDGECWACGPAASGLGGALGVSA